MNCPEITLETGTCVLIENNNFKVGYLPPSGITVLDNTPDIRYLDQATDILVLPAVGPPGPEGPPGPAGPPCAATVFDVVGVSSQTFAHPYAYPPFVYLVDPDGTLCGIGAEYPDAGHVHISWPSPYTGEVILL